MAQLTIYDSTDFEEVDDIEDIKVFYRLLYQLNEATLLMSQANSMSDLYRTAIVTATSLLDIDRIGILLVDELHENMFGTWGTDEEGNLCNEHSLKSPVDNTVRDIIRLIDNQGKVCIWENRPLYEFDKNTDTSKQVGFGWNGAIALWENSKLIGWIACDNLLKQRPFKPYISHILRLFGSVISEYRLRFIAQDKIEKLNQELQGKVQQLQTTITTLEETKLQLNTTQAHSAMKDLVVGVAHEINTPLGIAIMANSTYPSLFKKLHIAIRDNDKLSTHKLLKSAQQTIDILDDSLNTTASLITEFKRLSTIEVEAIPAKSVCLDEWLTSVINTIYCYEPQLKELNITLKTPSPSPTIMVHSEVLAQIIKEMLLNAFLHANKTENICVTISISITHNELQIFIEDNGIGIEQQLQEKIFNPFITTGRAIGRKGLGLNVVANLVTFLLKGKLSYFDSALGGAGFLIINPLHSPNKESPVNQLKGNSKTA
ncbi:MAG: HAMP domain-containing histidine kinase [Alteromonadales bacterium]|nr:HAMP domain-containing histidine kinase [Alteromonadales bacterium]